MKQQQQQQQPQQQQQQRQSNCRSNNILAPYVNNTYYPYHQQHLLPLTQTTYYPLNCAISFEGHPSG